MLIKICLKAQESLTNKDKCLNPHYTLKSRPENRRLGGYTIYNIGIEIVCLMRYRYAIYKYGNDSHLKPLLHRGFRKQNFLENLSGNTFLSRNRGVSDVKENRQKTSREFYLKHPEVEMLSFNYSGIHQNQQLGLTHLTSQHRLTEALECLEQHEFSGIAALFVLDLTFGGGAA